MRHGWNINPRAASGGSKEFGLPGPERTHHAIALGLIHPAMDCFGLLPTAYQYGCDFIDFNTGAAEHEGPTLAPPCPEYELTPLPCAVWQRCRPFGEHAARHPL